jgi:hypothetical protein
MASVNAKLRALRLRRPTLAEIEEINRQAEADNNDRGASILAATMVENALVFALSRHLRIPTNLGKLFENEGPLATFDDRVRMSLALSIFGADTHHNLETIKHVRNTFAHASAPITFATPEIAAACGALRAPSDLHGKIWSSGRHDVHHWSRPLAAAAFAGGSG